MTHAARFGAKIAAGVVGGLVGLGVGLFAGFTTGAIFGGPGRAEVGRAVGMGVGSVGGAVLCAFLVGRPAVARWCFGTAFAAGAASFLLGFVGPILTRPDSPQGPLLGIFVTGPLGFALGAGLGLGIGVAQEWRPKA